MGAVETCMALRFVYYGGLPYEGCLIGVLIVRGSYYLGGGGGVYMRGPLFS